MRLPRVDLIAARWAIALGEAQGLIGAGAVAAGVYLLAGLAYALLTVGGFLILGAWLGSA